MQTTSTTLQSSDGIAIATATHLPNRPPKASVLIVHGVGEYSGRYAHVVAFLVEQGYAVYTLDHRGHGRSGGPRGLVPDMQQAARDLGMVFDHVRGEYPGQKFFVLGHSMGSLISLLFVLHRQAELDGWVSSGSPLDVGASVSALEVRAGRIAARLLPGFPYRPITDGEVCRESDVWRSYLDDPLVDRRPMRLATAVALNDGTVWARDRLHELRLPILLMHGEADTLTPLSGSQYLYDQAGSPDKMLKTYPDMLHEILNDPERALVFADLIAWLDDHA